MKETLISLRKNWEFRRVYRNGRRMTTFYGTVFFRRNGLDYNRFGFSVSKKVGGSVCRHRVKRLYFEVLRRRNKYLRQGFDIVFIAKKASAEMDYHGCCKDVDKALGKTRLLLGEMRENN